MSFNRVEDRNPALAELSLPLNVVVESAAVVNEILFTILPNKAVDDEYRRNYGGYSSSHAEKYQLDGHLIRLIA